MVVPAYSRKHFRFARDIGLGEGRAKGRGKSEKGKWVTLLVT